MVWAAIAKFAGGQLLGAIGLDPKAQALGRQAKATAREIDDVRHLMHHLGQELQSGRAVRLAVDVRQVGKLSGMSRALKTEIDALNRETAHKVAFLGRQYAPVRTGRLRNSIQVQPSGRFRDQYVVGVGAPYGKFVEFGTRRMRAQPYLRPAAERVRQEYRQQAIKAVRRAVRKGAAVR